MSCWASASTVAQSVTQRLEDYWLGLRLQNMNIKAILSVKATHVDDSFIMHHAFGDDLGKLEEAVTRAFYGKFGKNIRVKLKIGVMLPSSFDGNERNDLTFEEQIHGHLNTFSRRIENPSWWDKELKN